jgi:hypothetical protein
MSVERWREAERVLMRVRTSAGPALDVERRVLAGVEQRIALEGDVTRTGAADATGGAAALWRGASLSRATSRWRRASHVAGRLGRWAAFGLAAGAIGYHFGWTARDHAASPAVASATAASATPGATRMAASPTELALAVPPPAEPASGDSAPALAPPPPPPKPIPVPAPTHDPSALAAEIAPLAAATGRIHLRPGQRRESLATKPIAPPRPLTLAELLERLLRAQTSLRDRDPHAALDELQALDALDTGGHRALPEERLVLRALALCDIGRLSDARRALSELDRLGAESIYRGRLEQACPAALAP